MLQHFGIKASLPGNFALWLHSHSLEFFIIFFFEKNRIDTNEGKILN